MEDIANVEIPEIETAREEAIEHLSIMLHSKMEHLEPTEDPDWKCLSERQQDFYRICVKGLLVEHSLLMKAMAT